MKTTEFVIRKFQDGRLMLLFLFRDSKNFRIHRDGNMTYYTWCPSEEDLKMASRVYRAVNLSNVFSRRKLNETEAGQHLDLKTFYT